MSDVNLFAELARILRPGGEGTIIPLYLSNGYKILSNPRYWLSRGIPRERGATTVISREYWESHGRFYDAPALRRRVLMPLSNAGLSYKLFLVDPTPVVAYPPFCLLRITAPAADSHVPRSFNG